MALKITSGKVARAQRVVIYGSEGIGKTSLAAQAPDPLIIDLEDGSSHIDVRRVANPGGWNELLGMIDEVILTPDICKTLILDTIDRAELMCIEYICNKFHKGGLEDFGYGKGYQYLSEEFTRLLDKCDEAIAHGINIIFIAHAKMRKQELPDEQGAFDRWELKLSKQVAPLVKEWPDALLFLNYKTVVVQTETSAKAQGGRRVIYTTHSPVWDAKNRHDLPDEVDLSYENIRRIFEGIAAGASDRREAVRAAIIGRAAGETTESVSKLQAMLNEAKIPEKALQQFVASQGYFQADTPISAYPADFIDTWVIPYWNKLVPILTGDKNDLPF